MIIESLELIEDLINQESYSQAIHSLEQLIEVDSENLNYYWYLGLVYLLQENEELAQEIWLSIFLQGTMQEVEQWTAKLIDFLEIKVKENIAQKRLGNAKIIYENITFIQPNYQNLELRDSLVHALSLFGSELSFNQKYEDAVYVYLEALHLNQKHYNSWHALALTYYHLENYTEAKNAINVAIELDSKLAQNYHVLGMILEKKGDLVASMRAYKDAIQADANFTPSYVGLGDIYAQKTQINDCLNCYQKALSLAFGIEKSPIFKKIAKAHEIEGNQAFIAFNLGYAAYFSDQNKKAIPYFEEFLKNYPDAIDVYLTLGRCYIRTNQPKACISLVEKAFVLFPKHFALMRLDQSVLPIIYNNYEEVEFYYRRFSEKLDELTEAIKFDPLNDKYEALKVLQTGTNYFLGFQGKNDIKIQKKYRTYLHENLKKVFPEWTQTIEIDRNIHTRKIRIGFASTRLHRLGELYFKWLKYSNKNKFEFYTYDISGNKENNESQALKPRENFRIYSQKMEFIDSNLDDICPKIMADNLDVLILPEIGLDSIMGHLSCLRMAPIQCTTWAHPVTSGSPNIDYFLSSDLMEPRNGQEHYSEVLIRLPNLGFSFEFSVLDNFDKKRSDFEIEDDSIVYLCCQSLLKYMPQYDYIFPSIAIRNPLAKFTFFDSFLGPVVTEFFKERISEAFAEFGLNYKDYCLFYKTLEFKEYLAFHHLSDIFLDSFGWSGGVTAIDAIACGLPIVTCPGETMRGRQSTGMLNMIGVIETIAQTEIEYINLAVRLGVDHEWRQIVKEKMKVNRDKLFDDRECIIGLEKFFENAVEDKLKIY